MQVLSPSSPAPKFAGKERFSDVFGELSYDFGSNLMISSKENETRDSNLENSWWNQKAESYKDEDKEREEEDFSFVSLNAENSPITAEEAFEDGQIRPVYPLFDRNLLFEYERDDDDDDDSNNKALRSPIKKTFVEAASEEKEEEETEPIGPFCSWKNHTVVQETSLPPKTCRKSNSTGFSKLWRFRDLVSRSNSDGKDAFVFLSNNGNTDKKQSSSSLGKEKTRTEKKMRTKSAHEKLYMRNRAIREEGERRSYLPYKHVGFFTNLNGLTRNVHPY